MDEITTEELMETVKGMSPKIVAVACAMSALAAALASTAISWKVLSRKFEERANEEIAQADEELRKLYKVGEYADIPGEEDGPAEWLDKVPAEIQKTLAGYGMDIKVEGPVETEEGLKVIKDATLLEVSLVDPRTLPEEVREIQTVSVFETHGEIEGWNQEKEMASRDGTKPYVISHDEFYENAPEYETAQVTWFEEDTTLVDARDFPITQTRVDALIGEENLAKFGHGSKDPNIVYVRNDKKQVLFEVLRNEGSGAAQIMGGRIQHDDRRRPRKMRESDE